MKTFVDEKKVSTVIFYPGDFDQNFFSLNKMKVNKITNMKQKNTEQFIVRSNSTTFC